MTYQALMNRIFEMTPEQRSKDVTIHLSETDEFFPVTGNVMITDATDVLDENHPYLEIGY